jgi:hypothetical protein
MTISTYRSEQPLFTVVLRDNNAKSLLTQWTTTSKSIAARVEDNRMHLFDHHSLSLFIVTWAHGWDNLVVWDPWIKRHILI